MNSRRRQLLLIAIDSALLAVLVVVLVSVASCQVQRAFAGDLVSAVEPSWLRVAERQRFDDRHGSVVGDVERHLWPGHPYRSKELANWAHEGTHGVNSLLRNSRPGANGVYALEGRGVVLGEPRLPLALVARLVEPEFRGYAYRFYLTGSAAQPWPQQPLYILDEWFACTNGTAAAVELAPRGYRGDDGLTVANMLELGGAAVALVWAVQENDPEYAQLDELQSLVAWNLVRAVDLAEKSKPYPHLFAHGADRYLRLVRQRIGL